MFEAQPVFPESAAKCLRPLVVGADPGMTLTDLNELVIRVE